MSKHPGNDGGPHVPSKWEHVDSGSGDTSRLRVPGGWLYRVATSSLGDPAVTFVPIPTGEDWP